LILDPKRRCPICGALVPNRKPVGKPYQCLNCQAKLQPAAIRGEAAFWISALAALGASWLLGCRRGELAGIALLLFFPASFIYWLIVEWIWPTPLKPYDGKTQFWG